VYNSQYVLNVIEDGKTYPYPYNNLKRAEEHFEWERVSCVLLEYINGNYHFVKAK
jgi:glutamate-1-semialdehyde aminotransferase